MNRKSNGWLLFAVGCLGIAGVLAFLVAMTRTPAIRLLPSAQSFYVILVGHVTFALVIWGLSFIAALWSYCDFGFRNADFGMLIPKSQIRNRKSEIRNRNWGLFLAAGGSGLILVSVLTGRGSPSLNDYVPVLESPLFFAGYLTFVAGILMTLLRFLATALRRWRSLSLTGFGLASAAACVLLAVAALVTALVRILPGYDPAAGPFPYQALFWGAGHALQYAYVAAMVVAWQMLAAALGAPPVHQRAARIAFALYPLFALPVPGLYLLAEPTRVPTVTLASVLLGAGLSLPTLVHILLLGFSIFDFRFPNRKSQIGNLKSKIGHPEASALGFSILLYGIGSLLEPSRAAGTLRVPAHYHGVVVGGMTIAFMGLTYLLLPLVGRELYSRRLARWQPVLYGVGVLILIISLAWAGALGAPRKAFDVAADQARPAWLLPMGLMGLGTLLAVAGGAAFVVNVLISLLPRPTVPDWRLRISNWHLQNGVRIPKSEIRNPTSETPS